jgi:hypothetical protein
LGFAPRARLSVAGIFPDYIASTMPI